MNLYRIKCGITTGAASWGDWKYYEDEERLLIDLLEFQLQIESRKSQNWFEMMKARYFKKTDDDSPQVSNIYAVEKVVNGEWVEVTFHYMAPKVWLTSEITND